MSVTNTFEADYGPLADVGMLCMGAGSVALVSIHVGSLESGHSGQGDMMYWSSLDVLEYFAF